MLLDVSKGRDEGLGSNEEQLWFASGSIVTGYPNWH
jgi:hypothetical protein